MNRRSFITTLGAAGLFTILPGAGRLWTPMRKFSPWVHFRLFYNYNDAEIFCSNESLPPTSGWFCRVVSELGKAKDLEFQSRNFTYEEGKAISQRMFRPVIDLNLTSEKILSIYENEKPLAVARGVVAVPWGINPGGLAAG
jgi:hypothetical protein